MFRAHMTGAALLGTVLFLGTPPPASAYFQVVVQEVSGSGQTVGQITFDVSGTNIAPVGAATSTDLGSSLGDSMTESTVWGGGNLGGDPSKAGSADFNVSVKATSNATITPGAFPSLSSHVFDIVARGGASSYLRIYTTSTGYNFPTAPTDPPLYLNTTLDLLTKNLNSGSISMQSFADKGNQYWGVPSGTKVPPDTGIAAPLVQSDTAMTGTPIPITIANTKAPTSAGETVFFAPVNPFALTSVTYVTGLTAGQAVTFQTDLEVSFDAANAVTMPAPGGWTLLGSALPLLGGAGWLRRRKDVIVAAVV